jgi:dipeptidyl aminopeptidase/acylaminoacyl peptidase
VRAVTKDAWNNARPSWSQDGRWLYFASKQTGSWEIWKAPVDGGTHVQITHTGGMEALASADGNYIYYTKGNTAPGGQVGIWRIAVADGVERRFLDRGLSTAWGLTDLGLVFMNKLDDPATIEYFAFAKPQSVTIARFRKGLRFDTANPSFSVSRDGRWIVYVQNDNVAADIEMLMLR